MKTRVRTARRGSIVLALVAAAAVMPACSGDDLGGGDDEGGGDTDAGDMDALGPDTGRPDTGGGGTDGTVGKDVGASEGGGTDANTGADTSGPGLDAALGPDAATVTCPMTIHGSLDTTDRTQIGRHSRVTPVSVCGATKNYPTTDADPSNPHLFDVYRFSNPTPSSVCFNFTLTYGAMAVVDAGTDAGGGTDAGATDAAGATDGVAADAGTDAGLADAGVADAGEPAEASDAEADGGAGAGGEAGLDAQAPALDGSSDAAGSDGGEDAAGVDAGVDASGSDAGAAGDTGAPEAATDSGATDSGATDSGTVAVSPARYMTAYSTFYPTDLSQAYLGDVGNVLTSPQTMGITVPPGGTVDVVVYAIDVSPAGVGPYTLSCATQ